MRNLAATLTTALMVGTVAAAKRKTHSKAEESNRYKNKAYIQADNIHTCTYTDISVDNTEAFLHFTDDVDKYQRPQGKPELSTKQKGTGKDEDEGKVKQKQQQQQKKK